MRKSAVLGAFLACFCLFAGTRNAEAQITCGALPFVPVTGPTQVDSNFAAIMTCLSGAISAPHTQNLTTLTALSTVNYPKGVWRDTYSALIFSPPVFYTPGTTACSLNSGAGDNGSQVPSADGKCWLVAFFTTGPDPRVWGADQTGVTDASVAFRSAIAYLATSPGSTLFVPPGSYTMQVASGSQVMLVQAIVNFQCAGWGDSGGSVFNFGILNNATDGLVFKSPAGVDLIGERITNCKFTYTAGSNNIRDTIRFDMSASNSSNMHDILLDHVFVGSLTTANPAGHAIGTNIANTNTNGGIARMTIRGRSVIGGGVWLNNAGDSIAVTDSELTGGLGTYGVYANIAGGAGNLLVTGNNITAACPVQIDAGYKAIVKLNEIEQAQTNSCSHNALVDLSGSASSLVNPTVTENQIQAPVGGFGNPANIYVGATQYAHLSSNYLAQFSGSPATCIQTTVGAALTAFGPEEFVNCSPNVTLAVGATVSPWTPVPLSGSCGASVAWAGVTWDCMVGGAVSDSFYKVAIPVPSDGQIEKLNVVGNTAAGAGQSYTITVNKNDAATTLTCTISGASAKTCQDTSGAHVVSVVATDMIDCKVLGSAAAATGTIGCAVEFAALND